MTVDERELALIQMQNAANTFYVLAMRTQVHPFVEFTGLMNEFVKVCKAAHESGVDFSACCAFTEKLPMTPQNVALCNEALEHIFTGQVSFGGRAGVRESMS